MTREEIIEKLKDIIKFAMSDSSEKLDSLTENSDLRTDVGLNSVGLLYIVIAVEEFFNISFDDEQFSDFVTVKDVIDYIYSKKN